MTKRRLHAGVQRRAVEVLGCETALVSIARSQCHMLSASALMLSLYTGNGGGTWVGMHEPIVTLYVKHCEPTKFDRLTWLQMANLRSGS